MNYKTKEEVNKRKSIHYEKTLQTLFNLRPIEKLANKHHLTKTIMGIKQIGFFKHKSAANGMKNIAFGHSFKTKQTFNPIDIGAVKIEKSLHPTVKPFNIEVAGN